MKRSEFLLSIFFIIPPWFVILSFPWSFLVFPVLWEFFVVIFVGFVISPFVGTFPGLFGFIVNLIGLLSNCLGSFFDSILCWFAIAFSLLFDFALDIFGSASHLFGSLFHLLSSLFDDFFCSFFNQFWSRILHNLDTLLHWLSNNPLSGISRILGTIWSSSISDLGCNFFGTWLSRNVPSTTVAVALSAAQLEKVSKAARAPITANLMDLSNQYNTCVMIHK